MLQGVLSQCFAPAYARVLARTSFPPIPLSIVYGVSTLLTSSCWHTFQHQMRYRLIPCWAMRASLCRLRCGDCGGLACMMAACPRPVTNNCLGATCSSLNPQGKKSAVGFGTSPFIDHGKKNNPINSYTSPQENGPQRCQEQDRS